MNNQAIYNPNQQIGIGPMVPGIPISPVDNPYATWTEETLLNTIGKMVGELKRRVEIRKQQAATIKNLQTDLEEVIKAL